MTTEVSPEEGAEQGALVGLRPVELADNLKESMFRKSCFWSGYGNRPCVVAEIFSEIAKVFFLHDLFSNFVSKFVLNDVFHV